MRIIIDLQGFQSESRFRGIGRYSLGFAQALVRSPSDHEFILVLNGAFVDTIEPIRALFEKDLSPEKIKVFEIPFPVAENNPAHSWRLRASEILREWFLRKLEPDWVVVTSLFEGWGDDACLSIPKRHPGYRTAVIFYDLGPLIRPEQCFTSIFHRAWYERKIESLKRADLYFSISRVTSQDGVSFLNFSPERIVTIGGGVENRFSPIERSVDERRQLREKYGLWEKFLLYVPGGFDSGKNIDTLLVAFSHLPADIRNVHQLVIPGKLPAGIRKSLTEKTLKLGLRNQVLFPGYIPDDDLIGLYQETVLFVYPSLYEGFGLPVLEAMACGAPVIGSNTTSVPEVIGFEKALFDPQDAESLSQKMMEFLSDSALRSAGIQHGREQVKNFSWDKVALRALNGLETFIPRQKLESRIIVSDSGLFQVRKKKILVLKLDHRGDFLLALPALKKLRAKYPFATVDLLVGSWNLEIAKAFGLGDSVFTFDFFQSQSSSIPVFKNEEFEALVRRMGHYDIAVDFRRQRDTRFLLLKIDASLRAGYETHDEGIDVSIDLCLESQIDQPEKVIFHNRRSASQQMLDLVDALGHEVSDFIKLPELPEGERKGTGIAVFPFAGHPIKEWGLKNFDSLIRMLGEDRRIDRINVYCSEEEASKISDGIWDSQKVICHVGLKFQNLIKSLTENVIGVANNSFGAHVSTLAGLKTVVVYGGHERVEEWAPVFGSGHRILHIDLPCSPCHLARTEDCTHGMECLSRIDPFFVAENVIDLVGLSRQGKEDGEQGIVTFGDLERKESEYLGRQALRLGSPWPEPLDVFSDLVFVCDPSEQDVKLLARAIALNHPQRKHKELFVDISELVRMDAKSGIQRVVRSILEEWLESPPKDYVVQPVYLSDEGGEWHYRYARQFSFRQGWPVRDSLKPDFPVDPLEEDILLALDLSPFLVTQAAKSGLYDKWKARGVDLFFLVYDLLPLLHPECFLEEMSDLFCEWVACIARVSTGLVCDSRSTENDLNAWLAAHPPPRHHKILISSFHLGGNFIRKSGKNDVSDLTSPGKGIPDNGTTFLMVGTLEPRKCHEQVLLGFDHLWKTGANVNLVFVGKRGWKVDDLVKIIQCHPELGKRLFWLRDVNDQELEGIYRKVHCLIMASKGEGFGLPLVEAAQRQVPVIARDLPVFREVLGDHAYYFSGETGESLSEAVLGWLELKEVNHHPQSELARVLTWKESAERLLSVVLPPCRDLMASPSKESE